MINIAHFLPQLTYRTSFALFENSTKFTILQLNLQILNIHIINLICNLNKTMILYYIYFNST